jgi:hypothetical protein
MTKMLNARVCMFAAVVPVLACMSLPASACKFVGYRNGEPHCITVSDGRGQPYTDGRKGAIHIGDLSKLRNLAGSSTYKGMAPVPLANGFPSRGQAIKNMGKEVVSKLLNRIGRR